MAAVGIHRMSFFVAALMALLGFVALGQAGKRKTTLFDHYIGEGGIESGLTADRPDYFLLNGKKLRIYGGSLHYFRVVPEYWRDRLRKFKAAGLNAIDVYVPWNLHEPQRGVFDFGTGTGQFSPFLDLRRFLQMAKEEDLFVVLRPGPYICAEWEFGGLPSWLLSESPMFVRSSFKGYQDRAQIFLKEVVKQVGDLQFFASSQSSDQQGGPIIAVQIENEFGNSKYPNYPTDKQHLEALRDTLLASGIEALLFTSDPPSIGRNYGALPGVFQTGNFKSDPETELQVLREMQPDRPLFVTEFWSGWFDHWFEPFHNSEDVADFGARLETLLAAGASVNFYMFHGGTSFGFMNGGNVFDPAPHYAPDVTSYDYNAPLGEDGGYTGKYEAVASALLEFDELSSAILVPERPDPNPAAKYPDVSFDDVLTYDSIASSVPDHLRGVLKTPTNMESLTFLNDGNGQGYGYVVYQKSLPCHELDGNELRIEGRIHDMLTVLVNGVMVHKPIQSTLGILKEFGSWAKERSSLKIDLRGVVPDPQNQTRMCNLDLMVENLGRANFGQQHQLSAQRKGLWEGPLYLGDRLLTDWKVMPLEFGKDWLSSLKGWRSALDFGPLRSQDEGQQHSPKMLRGTLEVTEDMLVTSIGLDGAKHPRDTFFDFADNGWIHGILFVNGFNVGRYHTVGPQKTLYVPGPLLRLGANEIIIFENFKGQGKVQFTDKANYGRPVPNQRTV